MAIKSRNFNNTPVLGGIAFIGIGVMMNLCAINFLLAGFAISHIPYNKEYRYPFAILLLLLLCWYFSYKSRYKRIIAYYEQRERETGVGIPPLVVILIYYISSFGLMLLAGLFKNGDWIFKKG